VTTPTFSGLDDLAGLTRHEGIDARPTLLRVLTDLYVQQPMHTPDEEKHFTELVLRLIEEVDVPSRIDTAKRLASYGAPPAAVVRRLACDVAEVADAILSRPSSKTPAPQDGTRDGAQHIVSTNRNAQEGAAALGELFFSATAAERAAILDDLASSATGSSAPRDTAAAIRRLEMAALQGRPHEFVREIERSLAIPRRQAERIVNDSSGEPMLVVAKALGTPIDVLQRILLLVNPAIGTSVRRVYDLSALYEKLPMASALRLVSLWQRPVGPKRDIDSPAQRAGDLTDARRTSAATRSDATPTILPPPRRDQRAS